MAREIEYYRTLSGERPAEEFLIALPSKARQKVVWVLKLIGELEYVPSSYFSKMSGTDAVWECRIDFGSNAYRILAFMDTGKVLLTNGFSKKKQKTPVAEIERAERYRKDYFQRRGSDNG